MFDPKQLLIGTKVEREHTDNDLIAKKIAKDHLNEDKDYYRKLKIMEESSMKDFKELLAKKGKSQMDPMHKAVKLGMLDELKRAMEDGMAEDVKGLKKVSVASSSKEGLAEGLEKAKEMVGGSDDESPLESRDESDSMMKEAADEAEEMVSETEEEAPEMEEESEIHPGDRIAQLEKELAELKAKKK